MPHKINRREFLKILGTSSAGIALSSQSVFAQKRKKSCIVIGAGFSGLAAAYKLKNANWNVTILESRDRIGGRVFSYSMPQNPNLICELGAEWVGESHERIKALCKDFKIPLQKHQFDDYLLQDGRVSRPGQWGFSTQARTAFEKTVKNYKKLNACAI
jgi:monoamine oxidase